MIRSGLACRAHRGTPLRREAVITSALISSRLNMTLDRASTRIAETIPSVAVKGYMTKRQGSVSQETFDDFRGKQGSTAPLGFLFRFKSSESLPRSRSSRSPGDVPQ